MKIRNVAVFTNETSDLVVLFYKLSLFVALTVAAYPAILPKYMRWLTQCPELIIGSVCIYEFCGGVGTVLFILFPCGTSTVSD